MIRYCSATAATQRTRLIFKRTLYSLAFVLTGALQGPYSPFARPINNIWQNMTDDAINACTCRK